MMQEQMYYESGDASDGMRSSGEIDHSNFEKAENECTRTFKHRRSEPGKAEEEPKVKDDNVVILVTPPEARKESQKKSADFMENDENRKEERKTLFRSSKSCLNLEELPSAKSRARIDSSPLRSSAMLKIPESPAFDLSQTNPSNDFNESPSKKITHLDFEPVGFLGQGAYGKVVLVQKKNSLNLYAMKIIKKDLVMKEKKEKQIFTERQVLLRLSHPNIIKLFWTFHDKSKLYFILEHAPNGDFSEFLQRQKICPVEIIKFYAAEIVNMLEYIHSQRIAHRDLKPENILIDENFHLKLTDFATAKVLTQKDQMDEENRVPSPINVGIAMPKTTFVGTADYVSPEVLLDQEAGPAADLWALGCIIYQMVIGKTPFRAKNDYFTFDNILKQEYKFPPNFPEEAGDLVKRLLVINPSDRLGAGGKSAFNGFEALKNHRFFQGIDFANLHKMKPPMDFQSIKRSPLRVATSSRLDLTSSFATIAPNSPTSKARMMAGTDFGEISENAQQEEAQQEEVENEKEKEFSITPKKMARPTTKVLKSVENNMANDFVVLKSELITKKARIVLTKKRVLVLTSQPKLFWAHPKTMVIHGDIPLTKDTRIFKHNDWLEIKNSGHKTFMFKTKEKQGLSEWSELINYVVMKYIN